MNLAEFQAMVQQNAEWFRETHRETPSSLAAIEDALGCSLPPSMKWLLTEWGYSAACGVDNLNDSVEVTLRCREALKLPARYVILNDWNDGGMVLFDTATHDSEGEYQIFWLDTGDVYRLAAGDEIDGSADVFDNYPAWVLDRLEDTKEEYSYE